MHAITFLRKRAKIWHCIISNCFIWQNMSLHNFLLHYCIWEASSKTRASFLIRGSKHLEMIKALSLGVVHSSFSRCLEPADVKLALVFDLLRQVSHQTWVISYKCCKFVSKAQNMLRYVIHFYILETTWMTRTWSELPPIIVMVTFRCIVSWYWIRADGTLYQ